MRFAIFAVLMTLSIVAVYQKVGAWRVGTRYAAKSCYDIYKNNPRAHSGYYFIKRKCKTGRYSTARVYCDMKRRICGVTGGWMKVTSLNMQFQHHCPSQLHKITVSGKRLCIKKVRTGCSSIPISVGVPYAQVCGKVIGYQYGSPDAAPFPVGTTRSIDQCYMDGVSITHGSTPRKHIWSYIGGYTEDASMSRHPHKCPCAAKGIPLSYNSFVGNHFYCESGNPSKYWRKQWYLHDPLWDGAGCPTGNSCCSNSGLPYFYRTLPHVTTDDIEVRVCADQPCPDEDIGLEQLELYVR